LRGGDVSVGRGGPVTSRTRKELKKRDHCERHHTEEKVLAGAHEHFTMHSACPTLEVRLNHAALPPRDLCFSNGRPIKISRSSGKASVPGMTAES